MSSVSLFKEYCTGCGLCHSAYGVELIQDEKDFLCPEITKDSIDNLMKICPCGGAATYEMSDNEIWGKKEKVYLGWSANVDIRKKASSGGVLTSLCIYLLKRGLVNGIIQTMGDNVYRTKTVISRTEEDVLKCMGSRYSVSAPLYDIKKLVKENEIYAFVGKPCDVSALRMYLKEDQNLSKQIVYMFSFFCAGTPSGMAQKNLLKELGCNNDSECVSLQYRGNGWPGYATAIKKDGSEAKISYNDSWGKILGRDVRKICRFCIDGIGEMADISCGDAWYLDADKMPDFSENEGRNVVFARNNKGLDLIESAIKDGDIVTEEYRKYDELMYIQKYQYERRSTMSAMLKGLRICGVNSPMYSSKHLKEYRRKSSIMLRAKRTLGIIKRCIKGKI